MFERVVGRLGGNAATSEVISRLAISLGDTNENVRLSVCKLLRRQQRMRSLVDWASY